MFKTLQLRITTAKSVLLENTTDTNTSSGYRPISLRIDLRSFENWECKRKKNQIDILWGNQSASFSDALLPRENIVSACLACPFNFATAFPLARKQRYGKLPFPGKRFLFFSLALFWSFDFFLMISFLLVWLNTEGLHTCVLFLFDLEFQFLFLPIALSKEAERKTDVVDDTVHWAWEKWTADRRAKLRLNPLYALMRPS